MRGGRRALLIALAALLPGTAAATPSGLDLPGQLIVVGRPASSAPGLLGAAAALDLREIAERRGVSARRVTALSTSPAARDVFPGGAWVLTLEPGADPEAAARRLAEEPRIAYAGPNHTFLLESSAPSRPEAIGALASEVPNDSLFDHQFALLTARVPDAWSVSRGQGILIAIIDSGVEVAHVDLASQIQVNGAEAEGTAGVDDDANGLVDDVIGYDFTDAPEFPGTGDYLERDPDPSDDFGHGTQVAGIAAAATDNGLGIAGAAPDARILAVRAGFRTTLPLAPGLLQEDDAAAAILYAVDRGARVINLSWGDNVDAPIIGQAVAYAVRRGVLVVAAAGNAPGDIPYFPSGYPGVLGVGATTRDDDRAGFSTFGQDLDLMAPGLGVLSTFLHDTYSSGNGTSFSAPLVSGVAALVWSAHPDWSARAVASRLRLSARNGDDGWNPDLGWGIVDAARAVADSTAPPQVEIESIVARGRERFIRGTVSDAGLFTWDLTVFPERAGIRGEIVVARDVPGQRVADSLGVFLPAVNDSGVWVARLTAWTRGHPVLEHRSRFFVESPARHFQDLDVALEAGEAGWNLAASWRSSSPSQGVLRLLPESGPSRTVVEPVRAPVHALRLPGPLPAGAHVVEILARDPAEGSEGRLVALPITVPEARRIYGVREGEALPAGTPMTRAVDWDGDGLQETLIEDTPTSEIYGTVRRFEIQTDGVPLEIDAGLSFRGIPVDAADADGDTLPELVVFRVDGWSVWESRRPDAFPNRQVHSDTQGIPLGFVATSEGPRLVVMDGARLRTYISDPATGYRMVAETPPEETAFLLGRTWSDADLDGRTELAIARQDGTVVLFEILGSAIHREGSWPVSRDLIGAIYLRAGTVGSQVLTVEPERGGESLDASLRRSAVRVRAWDWDGASAGERGHLGLAGYMRSGEVQWIGEDPAGRGVLLRRGAAIDLLQIVDDGVEWGGPVLPTDRGRVGGGAILDVPGQGTVLWLGASGSEGRRLEWMEPLIDPVRGGELTVEAMAAIPGALQLRVTWEADGCPPGVVERDGDVRGIAQLVPAGGSVLDTAAVGERVTYQRLASPCATSPLSVTALPPAIPVLRWEATGLLTVDFGEPLRAGRLPEVHLRRGDTVYLPLVLEEHRGRRALLVSIESPADSLILDGAWTVNGLPVGGARRSAYALPSAPEDSTVVLAGVTYHGGDAPSLEVTLRGNVEALESCTPAFRVSPPGWDLTVLPGSSADQRMLPLPGPLVAGLYTLSLHPQCAAFAAAGASRTFRVDLAVHPNPVRDGASLVVENAPEGTRATLLDVAGAEVDRWLLGPYPEGRSLAIAPGLYFLRLTAPDGEPLALQKIVVVR